jgi:hypothetical protein
LLESRRRGQETSTENSDQQQERWEESDNLKGEKQ